MADPNTALSPLVLAVITPDIIILTTPRQLNFPNKVIATRRVEAANTDPPNMSPVVNIRLEALSAAAGRQLRGVDPSTLAAGKHMHQVLARLDAEAALEGFADGARLGEGDGHAAHFLVALEVVGVAGVFDLEAVAVFGAFPEGVFDAEVFFQGLATMEMSGTWESHGAGMGHVRESSFAGACETVCGGECEHI